MRIIIEVETKDENGEEYDHPKYWDWVELVGPGTKFIGEA